VSQEEIARTAKQMADELKAQGTGGSQLQQTMNEREKDILAIGSTSFSWSKRARS